MVFDMKGFKAQLEQTDAEVMRELVKLLGRCDAITIKIDDTAGLDNTQISVLTNSPYMHSRQNTLLAALKECNDALHVKPSQ